MSETDVLSLSNYEEHIYNTFLRITRTRNNKPFKYRKEFTSLPEKTKAQIKKITLFLKNFEHIKVDDFFNAPYEVYPDETYFDLEYYTSLKATKAYTLFQKKKTFNDPDSDSQLKNISESLHYILTFCKDKHITLEHYLQHTDGVTPSFLIHLKEHRINIFVLLGFRSFAKVLSSIPSDVVNFIIDTELYTKIGALQTKLLSSTKAKFLIEKGLQKIQTILKQNS